MTPTSGSGLRRRDKANRLLLRHFLSARRHLRCPRRPHPAWFPRQPARAPPRPQARARAALPRKREDAGQPPHRLLPGKPGRRREKRPRRRRRKRVGRGRGQRAEEEPRRLARTMAAPPPRSPRAPSPSAREPLAAGKGPTRQVTAGSARPPRPVATGCRSCAEAAGK